MMLSIYVKQSHCRPGQALRVPGGWVSKISRQSAHEGGMVFNPMHRPPLPPRKYSWHSFLLEAESTPRAIVRPEGFCQWKIPITPSTNCGTARPSVLMIFVKCSAGKGVHWIMYIYACTVLKVRSVSVKSVLHWREIPTWCSNLFIIINNATCFGHLYAHLQEY